MKKNIILFLLLCPLVGLMAQKSPKEITPDSLLYETFSKSELVKLQQEAPINCWNLISVLPDFAISVIRNLQIFKYWEIFANSFHRANHVILTR